MKLDAVWFDILDGFHYCQWAIPPDLYILCTFDIEQMGITRHELETRAKILALSLWKYDATEINGDLIKKKMAEISPVEYR